jgi:glycine dehydrogenase subunit 1
MLAATVYMATMGKEGIKEVAEQSFHKAHYLADQINKLPGYNVMTDKPFFCDFLVQGPVLATKMIEEAEKAGFLAGIDTSRFPECRQGLLVSVTEKRTKQEMDSFVEFLKKLSA